MKLNSHSIFLFLILSLLSTSYAYQSCSLYKPNYEADCSSLSDKTKICRYKYNQCICENLQCSDFDTKEKCEKFYYYIDNIGHRRSCVYDSKKGCTLEKKFCSDWTPLYGADLCKSFESSRPNRDCRYNDGQCLENPGACSNYLMVYSDEVETRLRCETLIPSQDNYRCEFYQSNYCRQIDVCSTATTQQECESMILPDRSRIYECAFQSGKCVANKKYKDNCESYKTGISKETCESKVPFNPGYCVYDNTAGCTTAKRPCSEWKKYFNNERDHALCEILFGSSKPGYECRYINGDCVERIGNNCYYSFQYTDKTKEACESIIPIGNGYERCVYDTTNGSCNFKKIKCTEYVHKYDLRSCKYRITQNSEMKCVSDGEKCIERYEKCEDYKTNVNRQTCESIKPYNDLGKNICVFQNNLCVSKSWKEYEEQKYKAQCENNKYRENEYCSFVNEQCIQPEKNCLDIKSINDDLTEEICKEGKVSDPNKSCILKNDKKGCEEKIVPVKTTTVIKSDEKGDNKEDNGENEENEENDEEEENGNNEDNEDNAEMYKINLYIFMTFILLL